jgi:hypothetical protein
MLPANYGLGGPRVRYAGSVFVTRVVISAVRYDDHRSCFMNHYSASHQNSQNKMMGKSLTIVVLQYLRKDIKRIVPVHAMKA